MIIDDSNLIHWPHFLTTMSLDNDTSYYQHYCVCYPHWEASDQGEVNKCQKDAISDHVCISRIKSYQGYIWLKWYPMRKADNRDN